MDLTELLRSQAKRYRCTACGVLMTDCGINVLAQQGNRALVRVTCASCQDENLLQIIFQTEGETEGEQLVRPEPLFNEERPPVADPISADELVDLHMFLRSFDSGLAELVTPAS